MGTPFAVTEEGDADFARVLDETAQVMASLGLARETIPLIVAGGINSHDTVRAAFDAGATACRWGTPFAVTEEGDAHPHFKRVLADATPGTSSTSSA